MGEGKPATAQISSLFTINRYLGKGVKILPIFIEHFNNDPVCPETAPEMKYENFFRFLNQPCLHYFPLN